MSDWALQLRRWLEAHPRRSYKVKELSRALGISPRHYRKFRALVLDEARAGRIAALPRRRFQALLGAGVAEGIVEGVGHRPTHLRLPDGKQLGLAPTGQGSVVPGDRVRVRRFREGAEELGRVEAVLEAAARTIFGTLENYGGRWALIPEQPVPGLRGALFLEEGLDPGPKAEGQLARGRLDAYDPRVARPELHEVELLGDSEHPRAAMEALIESRGWPRHFSARAKAEAELPLPKLERRDCRTDLVFTIDPWDAKDHDDAIGLVRRDDGGWTLRVHIADVAAAVPEGGALDHEALERCTSVYPPGQVIPMLPELLSAGACSLHHGVERDCLCAEIQYSSKGEREHIAVGRTRIRSRASLSYEDAEAFLEDPAHRPEADRIQKDQSTEELGAAIQEMHTLAAQLRERRRGLGSLFLERPERRYVFGEDGRVAKLALRESLRSHWIIEEFMLEANRAVAETLHEAELPLLWRVHEEPDEQKIEDLIGLAKRLGVRWKPKSPVSGHDYAQLFAELEGQDAAPLLHLMALRSLMKAQYRSGWGAHFGLAFNRYTHFTSPIRRYPDLHNGRWLHRLIDAAGSHGWLDHAPGRGAKLRGQLSGRRETRHAQSLADRCSELEREAGLIERDCGDICAADYLRDRVGEDFEGLIVSLVRSGLFVELDGMGIDGFVGLDQMTDDWYELDPAGHAHVGQRSGRQIRLGQKVRVLLESVQVRSGRIQLGDLRLPPRDHRPGR